MRKLTVVELHVEICFGHEAGGENQGNYCVPVYTRKKISRVLLPGLSVNCGMMTRSKFRHWYARVVSKLCI